MERQREKERELRGASHRVVFAVLAEHLWGNPALGTGHPGPPTEAVAANCQLLAQAKVRDHGPHPAMGVGHGHQDVVGLQVPVHWRTDTDLLRKTQWRV